jgi:diguanylate cyclase (GGDEF)-like protein/PAS domain S-box-containing protein
VADALLLAAITGALVYLVMDLVSRRLSTKVEKMEQSEKRFRDLTELSADWFWETDAEHRVVWLSGGAGVALLFGTTPTYGKRFWEIPRVEVEPRALATHLERLEQQLPFFDLEISRADERGARQIHIISGQSRKAPDGRLLGYRGVGRDVTEQRRAERALFEAKGRLELALDGANLAEWHYEPETDELFAGDGWVRFLGHDRSPAVKHGAELPALMHPEDRAPWRAALVRALKSQAAELDVQLRLSGPRGWTWLHVRGRVTERGSDGRARRLSGVVADIGERKQAERALRETARRFDDVAAASGEYLWETDAQWRYTYLSERVEAVLGYPRAEMLGRRPREFMPLGEARELAQWFEDRSADPQPFRELVHRSMTKAGGAIWQSVSGVPVRDARGALEGFRGTAADITAKKSAEARIEYLATRDPLTGLPNRLLLTDRAGQAILSAARSRGQLALLCFDLDRFKLVNESLSHGAGDALLRGVAERLEQMLPDDSLARVSGDEFVLLQPIRTADDAAVLAQRVLDVLARPFNVEGRPLAVGASIGISIYPNDGRDFAELLKSADAAMFHAKESGRGTFRFFSPALHARAVERLQLENELRGALARSELVMHWQPVFRGRPGAGRVVGAEALVRWQHPARGLLLPEDFVPLAEDCGLIRSVGEWTLERTLSQAGAWQRSLPRGTWFAVNVSAPELAPGEPFYERVRESLRQNGVEGTRVEIEVTERTLMSAFAENAETLRRVGELGVRFAIDDFGTGYSSLAYLRALPINKLKIDRSFLRELDTQSADEAIVRAIVAMARTLGIAVAAEGVETEAQLARLIDIGCDEWQGHLFSPPLDAGGFERLFGASAPQLEGRK